MKRTRSNGFGNPRASLADRPSSKIRFGPNTLFSGFQSVGMLNYYYREAA